MPVSDDVVLPLSGSMGGGLIQADEELIFTSARDLLNFEHGTENFEPPTTKSNTRPIYTKPPPKEVLENSYAFISSFDTIFLVDDSGYVDGKRWREHNHLSEHVNRQQHSFAAVHSSSIGTKDAPDTFVNPDSPTRQSSSVCESAFSVKSIGAWTTIEILRKRCKSLFLPTLLGSLPIVSAKADAKVDQYPSSWPPVDLLQKSIDYAWNLTAPAIPILIVIGGGVGMIWTVTRKPKPRSIPALLAVAAPVIGLIHCALQPTSPKEVLLGWIVGSLWVMVWLNLMCRAYLALVQPQAYCWLSFIVGSILYMNLTRTEWINEEMSKGGKVSMGALCITAASALLPKVLAHRPTSLLPK